MEKVKAMRQRSSETSRESASSEIEKTKKDIYDKAKELFPDSLFPEELRKSLFLSHNVETTMPSARIKTKEDYIRIAGNLLNHYEALDHNDSFKKQYKMGIKVFKEFLESL